MTLLEQLGEKELKYRKEKAVAQKRGFVDMENIIQARNTLWDLYITKVQNATEKAGVTQRERNELYNKLEECYNAAKNDLSNVHDLALNLAPSPEALKLEGAIETLHHELTEEVHAVRADSNRKVTEEEVTKVDRQIDAIFEKVKTLPTLSPEEVRKEYDEFPEELLYEKKYPILWFHP
jgi:hypothetical protein